MSAFAYGRRMLVVAVAVVGVTWLLAGVFWIALAAVALLAVVIEGVGRASRHLLLAASVCFSAGLVMTVLEDPLSDEPTLRFALDRDLASSLGRGGGVLLAIAVILCLVDERDPSATGARRPSER